MSAAPEPLNPLHLQPQGEGDECITCASVLAYVRTVAARRDPALAHLYKTMPSERVGDGIEIALQILGAHITLKRRYGRSAKTGARAHREEIREILDSTNISNLVLAQAWLEAGYGALPSSPKPPD